MTLAPEPNRATPYSLREGMAGWPVYGLQAGIRRVGILVGALDGAFGPSTTTAVRGYQTQRKLEADGIAGPLTQRRLAEDIAGRVVVAGAPAGLARSVIEGEGGYFFGAVNWSVTGGVDCGLVQRRVYGPPFALAALRTAFEPWISTRDSIAELVKRAELYRTRPAVKTAEYALRLGVLAHNWPWAAEELSRGRLLSRSKRATWVPAGVKFPDGEPVVTYADWAEFYALGGRHGEARMTRYVTRWPEW